MIKATADKVIMEDLNHRKWIVYGKDGIFTHQRRIYKNYSAALYYSKKLMQYYGVDTLTIENK